MQKINGPWRTWHSLCFSNCKVFDLNFGLIDGPLCLEHFDSLWNMSRDLHGRSFVRECSIRKGKFIKNSFRALCATDRFAAHLSRHLNVSTSMFHFHNVVQFCLDYFCYVWDSEKNNYDRSQHLALFKVSRIFCSRERKKLMDKQLIKQIFQLVLNSPLLATCSMKV